MYYWCITLSLWCITLSLTVYLVYYPLSHSLSLPCACTAKRLVLFGPGRPEYFHRVRRSRARVSPPEVSREGRKGRERDVTPGRRRRRKEGARAAAGSGGGGTPVRGRHRAPPAAQDGRHAAPAPHPALPPHGWAPLPPPGPPSPALPRPVARRMLRMGVLGCRHDPGGGARAGRHRR